MGPQFDLILVQQRNCDDETVVEAVEKTVTPVESPVLVPVGIDDNETILPLRVSKRLQEAIYRNIQQTRPAIDLSPASTTESIDGDELILPFRISKRLQAAMYRRLEQRNEESPDIITATPRVTAKKKKSGILQSGSQEVRREEETPPVELSPVADINSSIRCDVKGEVIKAGSQSNTKRKRETFAVNSNEREPLSTHSNDEKKVALKILENFNLKSRHKAALKMSNNCNLNSHHRAKEERAVVMSTENSSFHALTRNKRNKKQKVPPPMCLQLLHCNHVGHKGWRCYRPSAEGNCFCQFHQIPE